MAALNSPVADLLSSYRARDPLESVDLARTRDLVKTARDPWLRSTRIHVTASALIVHPPTQRVLLRWHPRQHAWLQVGGHGDPGEITPIDIALREGREETGLTDLVPWPDESIVHVVVVPVAASDTEPAHEHADIRFVLATQAPESIRPEHGEAPLRWLTVPAAISATAEENLQETLSRVGQLLAH
ncbi:NUDIX domain-containing protein [Actinobacteria bacterium YIM 96077]|uniref:NUDIX hydrolase n=1 Tax=Phytoactinopolyspora halophila TaxID=1981511 RepID=A0A329QUH5_9ACTN|nr:NUDIX domain-containing protein [Phytoactinopolyspora halophila]AYY15555.1 NUDIX domain-containing protein [Actinobacteria bacterium YIM 96077]RAW15721.1 NUDIX hydrolase [Phytoactinopolyspora halophila]